MPFKLNLDRRHHIPRQQRSVTNWPVYEASLRQRGSLTVWFADDAIAAWAAGRSSADLKGFASNHPERIASLTLLCPAATTTLPIESSLNSNKLKR